MARHLVRRKVEVDGKLVQVALENLMLPMGPKQEATKCCVATLSHLGQTERLMGEMVYPGEFREKVLKAAFPELGTLKLQMETSGQARWVGWAEGLVAEEMLNKGERLAKKPGLVLCWKCLGVGGFECYGHIAAGRCFACNGAGANKQRAAVAA